MEQSKPPSCFPSTTNPLCPGSITPLCSSSQVPSLQKGTLHFKGTMAEEKPGLAWHTKHSVCPALSTLQQVQFIGVTLLTKHTWCSPAANTLCCSHDSPWLQRGSTLTSLGETQMGLTRGAAVGLLWRCWGSNPPSSAWVYCAPGQEGLHGTQAEAASFMLKLLTGDPESCILSAAPLSSA